MDFQPHDLHVIAVISNPVRFESRYHLYRQFKQRILAQGVRLWTVECAFGDRAFTVTNDDDPHDLQLRAMSEIWHKENMINLGIQKLSRMVPGWEYVAWVDADIQFLDDNWAVETIQALQHYNIVQPWQTAIDLGPDGEAMQIHQAFGWCLATGKPMSITWKPYTTFGHPGFAWAARRDALDEMGLLFERAVLGAGDHHMAWGLIGGAAQTFPKGISPGYMNAVLNWQDRALTAMKKDVGYVPGNIQHYWHGKKKDRRYIDRWKILIDYQFDPNTDIYRDTQGLFRLVDDGSDRMTGLRDEIRRYFRARNEDSIDLE